jgi:dTDP-4-dehydrorhamnose 3,5-epimerase
LVRVTHGRVFDCRGRHAARSPTFGKWVGVELSAQNHRQLWIPAGFAHGFLVVSDSADFLYKTTDYYTAQPRRPCAGTIRILAIAWPDLGARRAVEGLSSL